MRRILGLTSIRSDYELMTSVYSLLDADPEIDFRLLVSGAHLSQRYGMSVNNIRNDGFCILDTLETLPAEDSPASRVKSAGLLLQSAVDVVGSWMPDLIVFPGDREDTVVGAMIGLFLGIPTVHFFGGDYENDGHPDTAIRNATSMISTAHVVSISEHRDRLIAMGKFKDRICVTGSVALDKFYAPVDRDRAALETVLPSEKSLDGYALLIFHPVDSERDLAIEQFENILAVLSAVDIPVCIGYPNSDPGNFKIIKIIENLSDLPNYWTYKNLDQNSFLTLYKNARFIIGNSSSGIIEAASIPLGAVNVGRRQFGRMCGKNVIFCSGSRESITNAVEKVLSKDFSTELLHLSNPYGDGNSSIRAYEFIRDTNFGVLFQRNDDPLNLIRGQNA